MHTYIPRILLRETKKLVSMLYKLLRGNYAIGAKR